MMRTIEDMGLTRDKAASVRGLYGSIADDWDDPKMDVYDHIDYDDALELARERMLQARREMIWSIFHVIFTAIVLCAMIWMFAQRDT